MIKEIKTKNQHYFVDEHNIIQGEYKSFQHNGKLMEHYFFINDKRHGEYKSYYGNGQLFVHTFYQNGKKHGEYKQYRRNGELSYTTFFYQGGDLHVDPNSLTEKDKVYIMMSGRLPPRD